MFDEIFDLCDLLPALSDNNILSNLLHQDCPSQITHFGIIKSFKQRHRRLLNLINDKQKKSRFLAEYLNTGYLGWNAEDHTYWVAMQIEFDVMVREIQAKIALNMLQENQQTCTQLNMGEGKTSVIIPMISLAINFSKSFAKFNITPRITKTSY